MVQRRSTIFMTVILAAAVFGAVSVQTFLGPCVHDDGAYGACHWAGQALFGVWILIALESSAAALWKNENARKGICTAILFTALLGIFIPGTLISLCGMATMRCRALMRPAMTILFAAVGILSVIGMIHNLKK